MPDCTCLPNYFPWLGPCVTLSCPVHGFDSWNKDRKISWIKSEIAYEKAKGIHTYHQCQCGRNRTRAGKCWECLGEELGGLEQE